MVLIPCLLLAIFAPGYLFPQMAARMSAPGRVGLKRKDGEQTDDAEKKAQPGALGGQQPTTSGDESAVGEQVKEAAVPAVEEAKST